MLQYCFNIRKIQEMCDKAVNDFLPALKFVSDQFVTSKMIKKLGDILFANDDVVFINEDSNNAPLFCGQIVYFLIKLTLMSLLLVKMILKLSALYSLSTMLHKLKQKNWKKSCSDYT